MVGTKRGPRARSQLRPALRREHGVMNLTRHVVLLTALLFTPACSEEQPPGESPPDMSAPDLAPPCEPGTKVTPASPGDWSTLYVNMADVVFPSTQDSPPPGLCGTDSLHLSTGAGMDPSATGDWPQWKGAGGKAFAGYSKVNGHPIGELTELTYSTFSEAATEPRAPYLNVFVDVDGSGTTDILVFEPKLIEQRKVESRTWQTWKAADERGWWCVRGKAQVKVGTTTRACDTTQATRHTWSEIMEGNPMAKVIPAPCEEVPFAPQGTVPAANCMAPRTDAPGLLIVAGQKSGQGWSSQGFRVDDVRLTVKGVQSAFNFEAN